MSDIRAQSRRDAEFDRLLSDRWLGDNEYRSRMYSEQAVADAYEMGKRHGMEEAKPLGCQACRDTGLVHCAHPEDCGNFDEVKP